MDDPEAGHENAAATERLNGTQGRWQEHYGIAIHFRREASTALHKLENPVGIGEWIECEHPISDGEHCKPYKGMRNISKSGTF